MNCEEARARLEELQIEVETMQEEMKELSEMLNRKFSTRAIYKRKCTSGSVHYYCIAMPKGSRSYHMYNISNKTWWQNSVPHNELSRDAQNGDYIPYKVMNHLVRNMADQFEEVKL